jgi:RimJ/RimL family protein N-acetyltransferase
MIFMRNLSVAKFFISVNIPDYNGPISATYRHVVIGEYQIDPMPGCKTIGVSHALKIYPEFRGKGYATHAHLERLQKAKELGYDLLLATTVEGNKPQYHILSKFHWKQIRTFDNQHTGNRVILWYKHLTDPYLDYHESGV